GQRAREVDQLRLLPVVADAGENNNTLAPTGNRWRPHLRLVDIEEDRAAPGGNRRLAVAQRLTSEGEWRRGAPAGECGQEQRCPHGRAAGGEEREEETEAQEQRKRNAGHDMAPRQARRCTARGCRSAWCVGRARLHCVCLPLRFALWPLVSSWPSK